MIVGTRLKALREARNLSQGDLEEKTGLLRCYISRIENGHTIPSVETLEKFACALQVPLYRLFYDGEGSPKLPHLLKVKSADEITGGCDDLDSEMMTQFRRLFSLMSAQKIKLFLSLAGKIANSGLSVRSAKVRPAEEQSRPMHP